MAQDKQMWITTRLHWRSTHNNNIRSVRAKWGLSGALLHLYFFSQAEEICSFYERGKQRCIGWPATIFLWYSRNHCHMTDNNNNNNNNNVTWWPTVFQLHTDKRIPRILKALHKPGRIQKGNIQETFDFKWQHSRHSILIGTHEAQRIHESKFWITWFRKVT